QGPRGDQLAGTGADDGGAQDAPARVGYHLDMAHGFALGLGAVVLVIGPAQYPHLAPAAASARLRLGLPDMGQLRIGEGHAPQNAQVDLGPQAEQPVPDHQPGLIVGDVGELRPAGGVADRVDAAVPARAQAPVDADGVAVVADAGAVEAKVFHVETPAGGD